MQQRQSLIPAPKPDLRPMTVGASAHTTGPGHRLIDQERTPGVFVAGRHVSGSPKLAALDRDGIILMILVR